MKAVVYDRYGPPDVLRIENVDTPAPKDGEVLVRIHSAAVTRADCATRDANRKGGPAIMLVSRLVSGLRRPRQPILGSEFAGVVEAVGGAVTELTPGDSVFGSTGFRFGCHAEYITVPEAARITTMPARMAFDEGASMCDGGLNSLWCLRFADLVPGKSVLVYGASGAIGSAGVQLARHFGAEVTAVCSTKNLELVKSLGAAHVIDYTREDFTKNGKTYDVIFDAVGKHAFARCKGSLKPDGRYLATDGLRNLLLGFWTARFGRQKVIFSIPPRYSKQDVVFLKQLFETGEFRPLIDRRYPLEDVVEAARYVETEQKTGNVILTLVAQR